MDVSILAVNFHQRQFMLDDGTLCRMETLLDCDGDETEDCAVAVVGVGQLPDGRWVHIDRREYTPATRH